MTSRVATRLAFVVIVGAALRFGYGCGNPETFHPSAVGGGTGGHDQPAGTGGHAPGGTGGGQQPGTGGMPGGTGGIKGTGGMIMGTGGMIMGTGGRGTGGGGGRIVGTGGIMGSGGAGGGGVMGTGGGMGGVGGMSTGGAPGSGGGGGTVGTGPCAGVAACASVTITPLAALGNTAPGPNAHCYELTVRYAGLVCGNLSAGRTLIVNTAAQVCGGSPNTPPAQVASGYCIHIPAGADPQNAYFQTF